MKKLKLRSEVVRLLRAGQLGRVRGGNTQGAACDNTQGATKCDLAGCNPLETNWALRIIGICHAIRRALVEEHNRIVEIKALASAARLERDAFFREESAA